MDDVDHLYNDIKLQYTRYANTKAGRYRDIERQIYNRLLEKWGKLPENVRSKYHID